MQFSRLGLVPCVAVGILFVLAYANAKPSKYLKPGLDLQEKRPSCIIMATQSLRVCRGLLNAEKTFLAFLNST